MKHKTKTHRKGGEVHFKGFAYVSSILNECLNICCHKTKELPNNEGKQLCSKPECIYCWYLCRGPAWP